MNIFGEGELSREATIWKFRIVRQEGARQVNREVEHYNFHAILGVGFRVRSQRGTQFLLYLRRQLGERVHFWPFDDWQIPANLSAVCKPHMRIECNEV